MFARPFRRIVEIASRLVREQTGQTLIIVALALTAMLGIAGLAIDGGTAYVERRTMQNAADAGAMAGARALAVATSYTDSTGTQVYNDARKYMRLNGWNDSRTPVADTATLTYVTAQGNPLGTPVQPGTAPPANAAGLRVSVNTTFNTLFAVVLGRTSFTVNASATALTGVLCSGTCPFPMGVFSRTWVVGQTYDIFEGGGAGNFGWLDPNNAGSSTTALVAYLQALRLGTCTTNTQAGDNVHGNTGISNSSNVRDELDYWLNKPITVMIWDSSSGSGNNLYYHVVGFATFRLLSYDLSNPKSVIGQFISSASGGRIGTCAPPVNNTKAVNLAR